MRSPATGTLAQAGSGTLTLTGINVYSGTTSVPSGTLLVNGSLAAGSTISVSSGATLGGGTNTTSGTAAGTINASGIISPGASYGGTGTAVLNTGPVNFNSGSSFNVDLNGTTETTGSDQYDQLNVTGNVTIASTGTIPVLSVSVASGFTPAVGNSFTIIHDTGSVSGTFSGLAEGAVLPCEQRAIVPDHLCRRHRPRC